MTKFIRDSELRELQRDTRTGIYFVRKKLKGKSPLLKSTGTRERTKARRIALEELARYMATVAPIASLKPTFREIAQKVLALKSTKAQATQDLAKNRLEKHLVPHFGHMEVAKITENTWEQYIVDQQSKSDRTLADDAKLMMACMKYSFNERLLERKIRIRNPDPPNEEGKAYTEEEIARLMGAASTADMLLQIQIGYTMGMRHGEIASLRWDWIDFEQAVIRLPAEITKTRRGRVVPINREVGRELSSRSGQPHGPYVFPSQANPNLPIPDFDSQWQRTWKRAGIEGRFHFLRHTCISDMAARGIPESTIKKITGCSQKTLNKVYIHLKDDLAAKAVNGELGHGGTI